MKYYYNICLQEISLQVSLQEIYKRWIFKNYVEDFLFRGGQGPSMTLRLGLSYTNCLGQTPQVRPQQEQSHISKGH